MVQVINLKRDNTLGDSILAAMQGYQSGQDRKMKQDEQFLARAKTVAEIGKMRRESEMLRNPGQIPINPNTGKPAGFVMGGKFHQFVAPSNPLASLLSQDDSEDDSSDPIVREWVDPTTGATRVQTKSGRVGTRN